VGVLHFVAKSRGGIQRAEIHPLRSFISYFLAHLALGAGKRVFSLVERACRKLEQHLSQRVTILANEQHFARRKLRYEDRRSRMHADIALDESAVRKLKLLAYDMEDLSLVKNGRSEDPYRLLHSMLSNTNVPT